MARAVSWTASRGGPEYSSILATMADVSAATETATGDLAGDIGRRLALHRGRRGLRVAELAREVGVTPSLISQIERGQSRPSVSTLFALAQALDVPVDAFFRAGPPGRGAGALAGVFALRAVPVRPQPRPAGRPAAPAGARQAAARAVRGAPRQPGGASTSMAGCAGSGSPRRRWSHLDFFELVYGPGAESNPAPLLPSRHRDGAGADRRPGDLGGLRDLPAGARATACSSRPRCRTGTRTPARSTARAVTVILYDCPEDAVPPSPPPARHPGAL